MIAVHSVVDAAIVQSVRGGETPLASHEDPHADAVRFGEQHLLPDNRPICGCETGPRREPRLTMGETDRPCAGGNTSARV